MTERSQHGPRDFAAVVIGGSAGGLEALSRILERLPSDFRLALAVVLHMPSTGPNILVQVLSCHTRLPVREAQDKEPAEPGTIFVAPPGYHLLVDRGPSFALSLDGPVHFSRPSIDVLFESAADEYGERLIGVLLSGANEDGASGLQAIERAGGLAVVQAPEEAQSPTMPEAALARCPGARVAPAIEIAAMLRARHS
jgi:two-component system, chemotaxis family, protein-glutamate methylesterase/glutaminase